MTLILLSIIILVVLLFILHKPIVVFFTNDDNTLYIGSECLGRYADKYIIKLLKIVYPNKKIVFSDNNKAKLIIKSHFCIKEPIWNKNEKIPYVYFNGESFNMIDSFTNKNSITISDIIVEKPSDNYYYVPLFVLSMNPSKYQERIQNTDINTNRKLLGYCNSNCVAIREQLVSLIAEYDTTNSVYALGKCKGTSNKIKVQRISTDAENYNFYKDYNFVIAMENADVNGYVTEKIMNVFLAGSIPIYWGTKYVKEIFNEKAFIYVNDFPSLELCAKYIIELNNDKTKIANMLREPIFKDDIIPEYCFMDEKNPSQFNLNIANKLKALIESNS